MRKFKYATARQAVMISAQWCLQYIISKQDWSLSVTFTFNVYLLLAKHFNCSSGFPVFDVACFLPTELLLLQLRLVATVCSPVVDLDASIIIPFVYWLHYNFPV